MTTRPHNWAAYRARHREPDARAVAHLTRRCTCGREFPSPSRHEAVGRWFCAAACRERCVREVGGWLVGVVVRGRRRAR